MASKEIEKQWIEKGNVKVEGNIWKGKDGIYRLDADGVLTPVDTVPPEELAFYEVTPEKAMHYSEENEKAVSAPPKGTQKRLGDAVPSTPPSDPSVRGKTMPAPSPAPPKPADKRDEANVRFKKVDTGVWEGSDGKFYTPDIHGAMMKIDNFSAEDCRTLGLDPKLIQEYQNGRRPTSYTGQSGSKSAPPKSEPARVPANIEIERIEGENERSDLIEARDIAQNSDLVLQYEAEFRNKNTGETTKRKWLGINAWKLGLIEGYIKQGFSCDVKYEDTDQTTKCVVTLKKSEQIISCEGVYTKNRLKGFLQSSRSECCETFAFRNAIKKIVSLKDVVLAVKEIQGEIQAMGALPTKDVKELTG